MELNKFKKIIEDKSPITDEAIEFMLEHIGNPNPEIRDELIYSTWCELLTESRLCINQKRRILQTILNEKFLLKDLRNEKNNSVLIRSFTALLIAVLIEDSTNYKWISYEEQKIIINQTFYWLSSELDYRGFDENLGWIHAFAHGADLLCEIIALDICEYEQIHSIMDIIKLIITSDKILLWGEEDRLNLVIVKLLKMNKLKVDYLIDWCKSVEESLHSWQANKKWATFLQSLYFKMKFENVANEDINYFIQNCLNQMYQNNHGIL